MRRLLNVPYWLRFLLLTIAVAPLMLVWGEIFTRILFPQNLDSKMNILASDPMIGFTYKPQAVTYEKGREYNALYKINSLGLRDREYGEKKDGIFRVLLIGDSFSVSHGLPIEESLSRQLERALQSLVDRDEMTVKVQVVNGAAGGYSPYNYWKAYLRWATLLKPDVVVVGLSPDDYDSSNAGLKYLIEDGTILAASSKEPRPPKGGWISIRQLRKWLSWNSQIYVLLRNFLYYNDIIGRLNKWRALKDAVQGNQLKQFLVPQPENMTKAWAKSFSYLKNLKVDTASDGVMMAVVPIPLKLEIDSREYKRVLKASGLSSGEVDLYQPLKMIEAFCNKENIPLLDPRAAIEKRHAEVPCYFVYDGHWIEEGIRVATQSIASQWRRMRLPPWGKRMQEPTGVGAQYQARSRIANVPYR